MTPSRDAQGRILPGSTGNARGRPPKIVEETYLKAFTKVVTIAEFEKVIKKALEQARKGDKDARKFIADYIVGPPVQRVLDPKMITNPYAGLSADELRKTAQLILKQVKLRTPG